MGLLAARWGLWIATACAGALAVAVYVHEEREARRFSELTRRVDEVRANQSRQYENLGLHLNAAFATDGLADAVANRVLAVLGDRGYRQVGSADKAARQKEPEAESPSPRTPEQQQMLSHATQIAEGAVASGRLRRGDVEQLRGIFGRLGPSREQIELRDHITKAINEQRLAVEDPAFILF